MWDLVGGGKLNAIMGDPRQKLPSRMRPNSPPPRPTATRLIDGTLEPLESLRVTTLEFNNFDRTTSPCGILSYLFYIMFSSTLLSLSRNY